MAPWNAAKAKVQLRLSVQRLRTLQQKKEAQAKAARREIATLLEKSKMETAKIKVEALINEDIYMELLELLELYCELLLARFGLLDQNTREPDPGISEGVCSIIHAAPRTELKELHVLRELLMHKYGRDFSLAVIENQNNCINERVLRKLVVQTPSAELVDAYLVEIAKGYGIELTSERPTEANVVPNDITKGDTEKASMSDDASRDGKQATAIDTGVKDQPSELAQVTTSQNLSQALVIKEDDLETLVKRFNALKQR
ncbi:hypothetical protein AX15_004015 [Amanita polypyramis BW_CC]|nr:hypothetical protein AX15_004015 [Amanita polypyramis BW_CC]